MLFSVDTKVRGRFSEKRCGPSRRCARNASAALGNFVCYPPQKTFSTASVKTGKAQCEQMFSALPLRADIAEYGRHVRFVPEAEVGSDKQSSGHLLLLLIKLAIVSTASASIPK